MREFGGLYEVAAKMGDMVGILIRLDSREHCENGTKSPLWLWAEETINAFVDEEGDVEIKALRVLLKGSGVRCDV